MDGPLPVKLVQRLVDAHPEMTRLYTTLSANEMTLDPLFAFNPDLPNVNNAHTADRIIECNPGVFQSDAPWRVELPQGGVVWGSGSTGWPTELSTLPPNRVIAQASESGYGKAREDNSVTIEAELATYNSGRSAQPNSGSACSAGHNGSGSSALLAAAALGATLVRRRRRAR